MSSSTSISSTRAGTEAETATRAPDAVSAGRYLAIAAATLLLGFAFAWFWSANMKLAFMDSEYAALTAKQEMLAECNLGSMLIIGDSRADAGLVPNLLSVPATNIAVGGAKPVETYYLLQRALACPNMPKHVVLSLFAGHFSGTDMFWERSARFGIFTDRDLRQIARVSARIGDRSLYTMPRSDGFPPFLRDWLYANDFPTLNFASMLRGGLFMRYPGNVEVREQTLRDRGHRLFGQANGDHDLAEEAYLDRFEVTPLARYYFDRILGELQARGVTVEFVGMPVNHTTAVHVSPRLREGFAAFLAQEARRHGNFHVLGDVLPSLPDSEFGDEFSHLNARGAAYFSHVVDGELKRAWKAAP